MSSTIWRQSRLERALIYAALSIVSLAMLVPLAWMVATSLKTFAETKADPPVFFPGSPQWDNYAVVFRDFNFWPYLWNSILVSGAGVLGTLVSCSLAAYAFTVYQVRGKGIIFALLLSAMMLPAQVTVIPVFQLFVKLGLVNTLWALILPHWLGVNVFGIFLLRQFFLTIPRDYVEAARIDGASELRILWSVFLPLAKPALLTLTVFTFLGTWNDLWGPLIFLHREELYTLPMGLLNFLSAVGQAEGTPVQLVMVVATIMMVPIVIVFFLAQKRFIQGIATTGVKG